MLKMFTFLTFLGRGDFEQPAAQRDPGLFIGQLQNEFSKMNFLTPENAVAISKVFDSTI
jgi:hypothetical protein